MVDLYTNHFRIVDELGNRIELHQVRDAEAAASLVNTPVLAYGVFLPASGSGRPRLDCAKISPFSIPEQLARVAENQIESDLSG